MKTVRGISLQWKVALIFGAVLLSLLAIMLMIVVQLLTSGFGALQVDFAAQRARGIALQLDNAAETMLFDVTENAVWDDAYAFVQGTNPEFLDENFNVEGISQDFDVILVFDREDRILDAAALGRDYFLRNLPDGLTAADFAPLLKKGPEKSRPGFEGAPNAHVGFLKTEAGLLLAASHPILPSEGSGDPLGTLVYATFPEGPLLRKISEVIGTSAVNSTEHPLPTTPNFVQIRTPTRFVPDIISTFYRPDISSVLQQPTALPVTLELTCLDGTPAHLTTDLANMAFRGAARTRRSILLFQFIGGVILIVTGLILLNRLVLRRIHSLNRELERLSHLEDPHARITIGGQDEFAALAQSTNRILIAFEARSTELERSRHLVESVLDSASNGILALLPPPSPAPVTSALLVTRTNQTANRLLGLPSGQPPATPLADVFLELATSDLFRQITRKSNPHPVATVEVPGIASRAGKWFECSATSWEKGFVVTFSETTTRRAAQAKLQDSLQEIERFNRIMMGREERVIELKREVNSLLRELNRPPSYRDYE